MRELWQMGALTVLWLISGTTANAQLNKGTLFVGPMVGLAIPVSDFSEAAKAGIAGGVVADLLVDERVAIGVDLVYHIVGMSDDQLGAMEQYLVEVGAEDPSVEADYRLLQGSAHIKFFQRTDGEISPYVFGGIGIYNVNVALDIAAPEGEGFHNSINEEFSKIGINVGGGALFNLSNEFQLAVQGTLHNIFTEGSSTQFVGIGAGLVLRLV